MISYIYIYIFYTDEVIYNPCIYIYIHILSYIYIYILSYIYIYPIICLYIDTYIYIYRYRYHLTAPSTISVDGLYRPGEVGISAEQIDGLEGLGYVGSPSAVQEGRCSGEVEKMGRKW